MLPGSAGLWTGFSDFTEFESVWVKEFRIGIEGEGKPFSETNWEVCITCCLYFSLCKGLANGTLNSISSNGMMETLYGMLLLRPKLARNNITCIA